MNSAWPTQGRQNGKWGMRLGRIVTGALITAALACAGSAGSQAAEVQASAPRGGGWLSELAPVQARDLAASRGAALVAIDMPGASLGHGSELGVILWDEVRQRSGGGSVQLQQQLNQSSTITSSGQ
jgi:hypothetical protein